MALGPSLSRLWIQQTSTNTRPQTRHKPNTGFRASNHCAARVRISWPGLRSPQPKEKPRAISSDVFLSRRLRRLFCLQKKQKRPGVSTRPFLESLSKATINQTGSSCCLYQTLSEQHHQRSTLCDRHPCRNQPCFGA